VRERSPDMALQPTRVGVPPVASGGGIRPLFAGLWRRQTVAGG
jgi:hypothetical protein